jgi:hypothetical protein
MLLFVGQFGPAIPMRFHSKGTIPPELGEGNDAEAEHHARSRKKQ